MSCSHPMPAVDYGINPNTGNHKIRLLPKRYDMNLEKLRLRYGDSLLMLPCGKCYSCLKSKAQQWSIRCYLESLDHIDNCFITLTYNDDNCPQYLVKDDLREFIKKLRTVAGVGVKFFSCGEYGSNTKRPHYHALIFGYLPDDLRSIGSTLKGSQLFESETLNKLWNKGFVSVGMCDNASICYCARYTTKKVGESMGVSKENKEFILMSRRPGLGLNYLMRNLDKLVDDKLYLGEFGIKSFSRYILNIIKEVNPLEYDSIINKRLEACKIQLRDRMLSEGITSDQVFWNDLEADLEKQKRNSRGL